MKVRMAFGAFLAAGLVVALALAFLVSPEASSEPDGLNKVAIDMGFAEQEQAHHLEDLPTAGYGISSIDDERLSTGLAGVLGVAVTFAVAGGLVWVARRASGANRTASVDAG